jgi:hypothetical protein
LTHFFMTLPKNAIKSELGQLGCGDVLIPKVIKSFFIYNIVKLIYFLLYPLHAIKSEVHVHEV